MSIADEKNERLSIFSQLQPTDLNDIEPSFLRRLQIYGGAQGIWVDKDRTKSLSADGSGITVGILHTGMHYPDDLSEDGMIYHYPNTQRPKARDVGEIKATKNARDSDLPIFVILPGQKRITRRSVRLGWVLDADDASEQFLILFGAAKPTYVQAASASAPFQLTDNTPTRLSQTKVRLGQQRFRFQVMAELGCKCSVCSITHPSLIKAAHIRGKAYNGSDDWRNGVPLCSTHHDAFDAHLFAIDPDTLAIIPANGISCESLGLRVTKLTPLTRMPHVDALRWRFEQTQSKWKTER